jgi:hypothetical protein
MDILINLKDLWINFILWLKPGICFFIIRMGLMLAITYGLLTLMLVYSSARTVFFQVLATFLGIIIAVNINLEPFRETTQGGFALVVTFFFLCMVFLPGWLPAYLVPIYGHQQRLRKILRYIVWGLFIIQILIG